ncbi:hypothetical protein JOY44_16130 [Phormidium sp. CLA17]|uniref:hypothetical protein n=1 Tax=Leptolyngbya sp. Cla-17 TaxID=2803751 RepID=UPI001492AD4E|nr:hypothetical protein [Leptolyngbya sp. Cla-17]MBM0743117.1 hypothetical protein [Leptolyngbya sp. Cla-17]
MNIQRITPVLFGLLLSGGLLTPAVAAQPIDTSKQNSQVQHLTCVKDTQGLMCTVDEALNTSSSGVEQKIAAKADSTPSELAFNEQLGQMSNILLGIIYLGLPIALVFAILLHDKRVAELAQSIEGLERIWNQNPQS